ncbi:MAG: antitoxin Xre-like helix-turn-helix domain-containing protein [Verrucomicrobiales bacterium]
MKRSDQYSQPQAGEAPRLREAALYPTAHQIEVPSPVEADRRIRAGLPFAEFDTMAELLGLTAEQLAGHLSISRSTLLRRKKAGFLDMQESDRLVRYARVFSRACEVLGSEATARTWLQQPARALDFNGPLSFSETEVGAREVESLLGRIEHGVFS